MTNVRWSKLLMIHIATGNSKTGKIHSFSTLPGDANHLLKLSGTTLELSLVPGTCGDGACEHCFKDCYAVKYIKLYYKTCVNALEDNTLALRDGTWIDEIKTYLTRHKSVKLFRWNVSGEIESYLQFISMNSIAHAFPNITFAVYTKRYDIIERFFTEYGDTENNLIVNISQWMGSADAFINKWNGQMSFNVFEFDPSFSNKSLTHYTAFEKMLNTYIWSTHYHCPSVDSNGKARLSLINNKRITCDICKKCYTKHNSITSVFAH